MISNKSKQTQKQSQLSPTLCKGKEEEQEHGREKKNHLPKFENKQHQKEVNRVRKYFEL